jgi:hypothetical protein
MFANRNSRAFQDTSLWPDKSLLNDTFGGEVSKTWAIVSPLWRTILYNAGYYSRRDVAPSHLSSQNLISEPSLIEKVPKPKKCFFVAIRPAQKCESPGFQRTWDNALEPTYFFLRMFYRIPSSVSSLNSHFPRRAVFLTDRSWIPSPPWSLGQQTTLHLVNRYFFFSLSPCQKNLDRK